MKKIMFIMPSLMRGGAETQAIDLINEVNSDKFEKHVCVLSSQLDQKDKLDLDNISLTIVERQRFFDIKAAKEIARHIDKHEIDVVHCTLQIALLYAYMASWFTKRKVKIATTIHTTKNVSIKNELIDRVLYRVLLRKSDDIVFVCNAQKDFWLNKYPEMKAKSLVVYNGIDTEKFTMVGFREQVPEIKKTLSIPDSSKVIINIAGFRPEKGHLILLDSFSKIGADVHLILAGDGVLKNEIEQKIKELDLVERVHMLGNVADVRPFLAISDLSILSSTAVETFSIAMLESMSMEVPMVATDIGGLKEAIIEGETGGLVEPGDVDALSDKVNMYLKDESALELMKYNARKLVVDKFTKEGMARATEKIFL